MRKASNAKAPEIEGLDASDLLERIGGDVERMRGLLVAFVEANRDASGTLASLIDQDPSEAKVVCHTLKGVLGNIGATYSYETCIELNEMLRRGRIAEARALLDRFGLDLENLCRGIERFSDRARPAEDGAAGEAEHVDAAWLSERYATLRPLLVSHRARGCAKVIDEISAVRLPEGEVERFERIAGLVRAYRMREALELVDGRSNG